MSKQTGVELIAKERQEQIENHGFTAEHDAGYVNNELATVALVYLTDDLDYWPESWDLNWYKPSKPGALTIKDLTKAGALIAAEIDRLNAAEK